MKISFKSEIKDTDRIDEEYLIKELLKIRGVKDQSVFMNPPPPFDLDISYFGFEKEIKKTLSLLDEILKSQGTVVVYTDYDADGITGGAILVETLETLGFKVHPYVPHRQLEGYGFSVKGIDNVKKKFNPELIISVDHGIAAPDQIAYAHQLGMEVIVTDHHVKQERIPDKAEAIFHIPALSGSGVSYFFSKMVFEHFKKSPLVNKKRLVELENHFQADYIALASIGTIADLVPLVGPSRSLVKYGLTACTTTKRVGICELLKQAGINGKKITPYEVGFIIAPRINAIGRLEHAIDALTLLTTVNFDQAFQLAGRVGKLNVERQDLVKKSVVEAKSMVESMKQIPNIIVLKSDSWHEGIIGLIASKITETYYRPTIVMTKSDGFYKGSARSIPALHIMDTLKKTKEHLLNVGGHAQAAGFSIEEDKIPHFLKMMQKIGEQALHKKELERFIEADFKIPIEKASVTLAKKLESLEPYGIGNPQVTFYSQAKILEIKTFGKQQEHMRIYAIGPVQKWYPLELISFNGVEKWPTIVPGQSVEVVYQLEIDRWGGTVKGRGKLLYVSPL